MTLAGFQQRSEDLARAFAVALGVSIPFSVAVDGVLLALVLGCWLAADRYRERFAQLRRNPVALMALGFVALLAVGLAYGEQPREDALRYFGKYADLVVLGLFVTLFGDPAWRRRALLALAAALAVLVWLSYLVKLGVVPPVPWLRGRPDLPVVALDSLTHGILVAFGAFLFAVLGLHAPRGPVRTIWFALAVAAVANVLFIVPGRTGYVVLAALALYLGYARRRLIGLALVALGGAVLVGVGLTASATLQSRLDETVREAREWQPGVPAKTSVGYRLEFYYNTLGMIRDHPLVGAGTGGFPSAYKRHVARSAMEPAAHPHNEYLLMTAQLGVAGLVALLALFWVPWRLAPRLPLPHEQVLARGVVLTIAVGCVFNSLLLDHTEGLFFAWGLGVLFGGLNPARGDYRFSAT
ncbi:MAG TPA: O-antigen ligase family protein [Burkholderiales bacterium]|nr:O-antigen ligase family protein [Burkholderiales bacterium]